MPHTLGVFSSSDINVFRLRPETPGKRALRFSQDV